MATGGGPWVPGTIVTAAMWNQAFHSNLVQLHGVAQVMIYGGSGGWIPTQRTLYVSGGALSATSLDVVTLRELTLETAVRTLDPFGVAGPETLTLLVEKPGAQLTITAELGPGYGVDHAKLLYDLCKSMETLTEAGLTQILEAIRDDKELMEP